MPVVKYNWNPTASVPAPEIDPESLSTAPGILEQNRAARAQVEDIARPLTGEPTTSSTALPTLATLLASRFLGPIATPTVAALSTAANQFLGLEPKAREQIVLSGLLSMGMGTAAGLPRNLAKVTPTGRTLRKAGLIREAEALPEHLMQRPAVKPGGPLGRIKSEPVYKALQDKFGETVLPSNFPATEGLLAEIAGTRGFPKALAPLQSTLRETNLMLSGGTPAAPRSPINVNEITSKITQLNEIIGGLESSRVGLGRAKQLRGALLQDFDTAAGQAAPGASRLFQQARRTAQREFAVKDLQDVIFGKGQEKRAYAGIKDIDGLKVLDELEDLTNPQHPKFDRNFVAGLGNDLPEIKALFQRMSDFGPVKPRMGPAGLVIRGTLAGKVGAVGAAVGGAIAGPPGAIAVGAPLAILGAVAPEALEKAVAKVVSSKMGRDLVEKSIARNGRTPSAAFFQGLAQHIRSNESTQEAATGAVESTLDVGSRIPGFGTATELVDTALGAGQ